MRSSRPQRDVRPWPGAPPERSCRRLRQSLAQSDVRRSRRHRPRRFGRAMQSDLQALRRAPCTEPCAAGESRPPGPPPLAPPGRLGGSGWGSSQTRRRRPEESVQIDHRGLRASAIFAARQPWCAASPASRSCGPTTPSTAPPGSRGPRVESDISSRQPGCTPRPRRRGLHEGLDQHGGDQNNRAPSLSDDNGRAAAYRFRPGTVAGSAARSAARWLGAARGGSAARGGRPPFPRGSGARAHGAHGSRPRGWAHGLTGSPPVAPGAGSRGSRSRGSRWLMGLPVVVLGLGAEETDHTHEIITAPEQARGGYARSDLFERRQRLMHDCAEFLTGGGR